MIPDLQALTGYKKKKFSEEKLKMLEKIWIEEIKCQVTNMLHGKEYLKRIKHLYFMVGSHAWS